MRIKRFTPILWVMAISFLLASCGTSNQFASSFGKRKYMKGYYRDSRSTEPAVASASAPESDNSVATSAPVKSEVVTEKASENNNSNGGISVPAKSGAVKHVTASTRYSSNNSNGVSSPVVAEGSQANNIVADEYSPDGVTAVSSVQHRSSDGGGGPFDFHDHPVRTILFILLFVLIIVLIIVLIANGATPTVTAGP